MLEIIQIIIPLLMFLITPIGYAVKGLVQNYRFKRSRIEGFHLSIRYFDSKDDPPIIELIRIRSRLFNIVGNTVYFFKDQNYQLDLKFSKQHQSVISGTWKNKNDSAHYGEFAWNFNFDTKKSTGFWSATNRDGLIEFGRWELKKLNQNIASVLNNRLYNKKITRKCPSNLHDNISGEHDREPPSNLYDNILGKHDREPTKPFSFNDKEYDIMKNVFNPQFGKIGRPLIKYFFDNYDISQFKNILDWGTGCGYYCIEIALKQNQVNIKSKIFALESGAAAIQCAQENMMKFSMGARIELIDNDRISNNKFDAKFDLIIANMPFSEPRYLVNHKKHPMYNCFCAPPDLALRIYFEIKNALGYNGIALLTFADSGDRELLTDCLELLDMTAKELFRIDKYNGATDDNFYAYEIKNKGY